MIQLKTTFFTVMIKVHMIYKSAKLYATKHKQIVFIKLGFIESFDKYKHDLF